MARRFSSSLLGLASALVPLVAFAQLERSDVDTPAGASAGDETGSFWASPETAEEPVDVQFRGLDLERAVRFLTGEESNVIAAVALDRSISADLRHVQPATALDMLLQREALSARFEGNTVFLSAKETRTYQLPLVLKKESETWDELKSGIDDLRSSDGLAALNNSDGPRRQRLRGDRGEGRRVFTRRSHTGRGTGRHRPLARRSRPGASSTVPAGAVRLPGSFRRFLPEVDVGPAGWDAVRFGMTMGRAPIR
jgi:hypothetical protein